MAKVIFERMREKRRGKKHCQQTEPPPTLHAAQKKGHCEDFNNMVEKSRFSRKM